jgi:hypothetical protein
LGFVCENKFQHLQRDRTFHASRSYLDFWTKLGLALVRCSFGIYVQKNGASFEDGYFSNMKNALPKRRARNHEKPNALVKAGSDFGRQRRVAHPWWFCASYALPDFPKKF